MTPIEYPWQGLKWAVHRRALITALNVDTMPPAPWMWPRSTDPSQDRWLRESEADHVKDELRTLGGVFGQQEEKPTRHYDLADPSNAARLFAAVGQIDPRNTEDVVRLIDEWGLLGVGMTTRGFQPSLEMCMYESDSLQAIVGELELFQQRARWLAALQARDATALRAAGVQDTASHVTDRKERWRQRWLAFSHSLEQRLSAVHPIIGWDGETQAARPAWILRCPRDVLWAMLWDCATNGNRLRRCENKKCRKFFVATDPRAQCCSRTCSNRKAASDWYWTHGGRDQRKSRRTTRTRRRSRR
jgi:hypothetical protein